MARQYVLCSIPAAMIDAANVAYAAIKGEVGTVNYALNSNVTGVAADGLTHATGNANLAESEAAEWRVWLATNGCAGKLYPVVYGANYDWPRETWNWFSLKIAA